MHSLKIFLPLILGCIFILLFFFAIVGFQFGVILPVCFCLYFLCLGVLLKKIGYS